MKRPPWEVADVIRRAGNRFIERYRESLGWAQMKVLTAIERCRTAALGGRRDQCVRCGYQAISYNSCRNRHCPKCQTNAREKWLRARQQELLPVGYFHLVFSVPHALVPLSSLQRYEEIRSNVQYGENAGAHEFHSVTNLYLPTDSSLRDTPWQEERRHLVLMKEHFADHTQYLRIIEEREELLNQEEHNGGLQQQLFWRTPIQQSTLGVRAGFVFWHREFRPEVATQAEVYLTIVAVLHAAREGQNRAPAWVQHEHQRVLLSPYNFARFNDGVIQAALLRAAHPPELDYTVKDDESATMMGIIESIFANVHNDAGEATIEFTLAIAMGKLRLHAAHTKTLLQLLEVQQPPPTLQMFIEYILR